EDRGSVWIDAVVGFDYSDSSQPLRVEINNIGIDGKRVVFDAIRIERVDENAGIPLNATPGDSLTIINHNHALAADTNLDGFVTALDALLVINNISSGFVTGEFSAAANEEITLTDVNADGQVSTLDALVVLNAIRSIAVMEGEFGEQVPEEAALAPSAVSRGFDFDQRRRFGRCLEDRDWDAEGTLPAFEDASSSDASRLPSLSSLSADAVFGGAMGESQTNALASNHLDDVFSELDVSYLGEEE
ncbi:MAG: dockerin type I domain-containing protein, partial [Rubripirellula sp.]|nr:dockerin type I domain-containing protein [Rubripirellula sp.]